MPRARLAPDQRLLQITITADQRRRLKLLAVVSDTTVTHLVQMAIEQLLAAHGPVLKGMRGSESL